MEPTPPDQTNAFLKPRLSGRRFDGHEIPLEVLGDLSALQQLIAAAARDEFFRDNPARKRLPRGFTNQVELRLQSIEEGSAKPVITLARAAAVSAALVGSIDSYYGRGLDKVVKAIEAAVTVGDPRDHLSPELLNHFQRVGRSLRPDEMIAFGADNASAQLTPRSRKQLVAASTKPTFITEEVEVRATVVEFDKQAMTCRLRLLRGDAIGAPVPAELFKSVSEAFAGDHSPGSSLMVAVSGVARVEAGTDRIDRFESIEDLTELDPLDVSVQLDDLRLLEAGWLMGDDGKPAGKRFKETDLDWLEESLLEHLPDSVPLPHLYPTPEGGVRAEWDAGAVDLSVEFDLAAKSMEWHRLDLDADDEGDFETHALGDAAAWSALMKKLESTLGAGDE